QYTGLDEALVVVTLVADQLGAEEINPCAVRSARHLSGVAAIAAEQLPVARHVEVNGPLVALQVVPGPLARLDVVACQPEDLAAGSLQVVPHNLAVVAPELVPEYLHRHGGGMDLGYVTAVRAYGPQPIHLVPRTFVAEHQQRRVGR